MHGCHDTGTYSCDPSADFLSHAPISAPVGLIASSRARPTCGRRSGRREDPRSSAAPRPPATGETVPAPPRPEHHRQAESLFAPPRWVDPGALGSPAGQRAAAKPGPPPAPPPADPVPSAPALPGFVYDPVRRRYFPEGTVIDRASISAPGDRCPGHKPGPGPRARPPVVGPPLVRSLPLGLVSPALGPGRAVLGPWQAGLLAARAPAAASIVDLDAPGAGPIVALDCADERLLITRDHSAEVYLLQAGVPTRQLARLCPEAGGKFTAGKLFARLTGPHAGSLFCMGTSTGQGTGLLEIFHMADGAGLVEPTRAVVLPLHYPPRLLETLAQAAGWTVALAEERCQVLLGRIGLFARPEDIRLTMTCLGRWPSESATSRRAVSCSGSLGICPPCGVLDAGPARHGQSPGHAEPPAPGRASAAVTWHGPPYRRVNIKHQQYLCMQLVECACVPAGPPELEGLAWQRRRRRRGPSADPPRRPLLLLGSRSGDLTLVAMTGWGDGAAPLHAQVVWLRAAGSSDRSISGTSVAALFALGPAAFGVARSDGTVERRSLCTGMQMADPPGADVVFGQAAEAPGLWDSAGARCPMPVAGGPSLGVLFLAGDTPGHFHCLVPTPTGWWSRAVAIPRPRLANVHTPAAVVAAWRDQLTRAPSDRDPALRDALQAAGPLCDYRCSALSLDRRAMVVFSGHGQLLAALALRPWPVLTPPPVEETVACVAPPRRRRRLSHTASTGGQRPPRPGTIPGEYS
ncbi:hypothetical protein H696_01627 [Fonticula alba]|uniref:Uncharacterized protein n=1 Tax=Fonticula alba TaxID=691883 RepID=A0A058ZFH1_FONAL|nr:hypothetical protein H696_01627 [Fonticula alba]KCV72227.1 hypothetical protein H696_01627 [Fonticula alba]|eukprot:XP_009493805.1 hypothetical protein H696_01627 [Fonticula alba]